MAGMMQLISKFAFDLFFVVLHGQQIPETIMAGMMQVHPRGVEARLLIR
jgi:hypothetical protein